MSNNQSNEKPNDFNSLNDMTPEQWEAYDDLLQKLKNNLIKEPFWIPNNNNFLARYYNFKYKLNPDFISRAQIVGWEFALNFVVNYCNNQNLHQSEEELVKEISNSDDFKRHIESLWKLSLSTELFESIINSNKPIMSSLRNPFIGFRRNAIYIILYMNYSKSIDAFGGFLDHERLANIWVDCLLKHNQYYQFKPSKILLKSYPLKLQNGKLSTINSFIKRDLKLITSEYVDMDFDFSWIKRIDDTFHQIYGSAYLNSDSKEVPFSLFSKEEQELFIFVISFIIGTTDAFPYSFNEMIQNVMIRKGIDEHLLTEVLKDFVH